MASKELDTMKSILSNLDSQATKNPQPSKTMNSGTATIDGANPSSPSTNNATRREQYANYIKTLDKNQATSLYNTVKNYKEMGLTDEQIYENVLNSAGINQNNVVTPTATSTNTNTVTKNSSLDLKTKGNFDMYEPTIDYSNADSTYQKAMKQLTKSVNSLGSLKLASENYQYTTGSTNVADINNIIKEIQKAYSSGIYDTQTIANQLGVSPEIIRTIQQGKASELVSIGEEFAQEQLKKFFRAEEDYDTNMQRTMEDYALAKTNLDAQFNSAMQTLKRNLFNDKRAASVGSAVAGVSGSEYMISTVEKQYQQNMDDLETNYIYSSLKQRYSYLRAIQDYNTNIERLGEDFDDAVKSIQASVLQQFQEIDNKILSAEENLAALSKLQGSTSTAMSDAILKYIQGIEDANERQKAMQNFIAANYGYDVSQLGGSNITSADVATAYNGFVTKFADIIASGGKIREGWCGEPVNEYLKFLGIDLSLTQANDLKPYATSQVPTAGAIAYFDGSQSRATDATKKYGHTGIVVDYNLDKGTVTLLESNKNTGMRTHTYKLSDVTGYLDPTKQSTGGGKSTTTETGGNGTYAQGYEADYRNWITNGTKGFTAAAKKTIESEFGSWNEFVKNAEAYKPQIKKEDLNIIQGGLNMVNSIIDEYQNATKDMSDTMIAEATAAFGLDDTNQLKIAAIQKYPEFYTAYLRYNQWIAQGFIDTIISSKKSGATYGQLSDNEGKKLSAAFTPTVFNMPKDQFLKLMNEAKTDLEGDVKAIKKTIPEYSTTSSSTSGINTRNLLSQIPKLLTSITNPSSQAAADTFSNPGRTAPMSTANGGTTTGVYQTMMPK